MKSIKMRLPCVTLTVQSHHNPKTRATPTPVLPAAAVIQSPGYARTRSWQQIFGGWAAVSHPAVCCQHNLHYTQPGLPDSRCGWMTGDYRKTLGTVPRLFILPLIIIKIGVFILMRDLDKAIRN